MADGGDGTAGGRGRVPRVPLVEELGRGAFGRVFLARQGDLADRPVALKVGDRLFGESQTLAQLQHTNIVPIYSLHRAGPFQAVCMPYFGRTTLADVLQRAPRAPRRCRRPGDALLEHRRSGHASATRAAPRRRGPAARRRHPAGPRAADAGRPGALGRAAVVRRGGGWARRPSWPTGWPTPTTAASSTAT